MTEVPATSAAERRRARLAEQWRADFSPADEQALRIADRDQWLDALRRRRRTRYSAGELRAAARRLRSQADALATRAEATAGPHDARASQLHTRAVDCADPTAQALLLAMAQRAESHARSARVAHGLASATLDTAAALDAEAGSLASATALRAEADRCDELAAAAAVTTSLHVAARPESRETGPRPLRLARRLQAAPRAPGRRRGTRR